MKPVAILILIPIVVALFILGRAILAARDRLEEWLLRRRLYGLAVVALGALLYLSSERYNRGLGVLLGVSGLIGLAFERSSAPSRVLIHRVHLLILSTPLAIAVWAIATLPPAALWSRLVYCAVAFVAPLIVFREARQVAAGDAARFQKRVHDMEAAQAVLEARPIGPNAQQVKAFLAALNRLTPGQWETVMSRGEPGIGAVRALEQSGRAEERYNAVAMLSSQLDGDYRRGSVASMAVEALVVRDQMNERDLAALYAPFELFIPIAALGGQAPSTPA